MTVIAKLWQGFKLVRGGRGLRDTARMLWLAPKQVALVGRLLGDNRVPPVAKAVVVGAGVFAVSPLNVAGWLPVLGVADDIGIALIALNLFYRLVPADILSEHRQAVGLEPKPIRVRAQRNR